MTDSENFNGEGDDQESFQIVPVQAIVAANRAQHDRAMMLARNLQNDIDNLFDEMTAEQMFTFYRMMTFTVEVNQGAPAFWSGVAATYLRKIHKKCTGCGDNEHTPEELLLGQTHDKQE